MAVIAQKKADINGVSPETQALLHKIISRYAEEIADTSIVAPIVLRRGLCLCFSTVCSM
ncbi:MAG: hypothetical protein IPL35_04185 [Sphingobacteriales bacterium]|nr:hypothetical protein [Sphingobacteriales bacterium]